MISTKLGEYLKKSVSACSGFIMNFCYIIVYVYTTSKRNLLLTCNFFVIFLRVCKFFFSGFITIIYFHFHADSNWIEFETFFIFPNIEYFEFYYPSSLWLPHEYIANLARWAKLFKGSFAFLLFFLPKFLIKCSRT